MDNNLVLVSIVLGAFDLGAVGMGRTGRALDRMEIAAAANVAKQETTWQWEKYRIETLRMQWLTMPIEARREYARRYGAPRWAGEAKVDPLEGVPKVTLITAPMLKEARA
jgi:hypothetical protein